MTDKNLEKFLYLEDVEGEKALEWAADQTQQTIDHLKRFLLIRSLVYEPGLCLVAQAPGSHALVSVNDFEIFLIHLLRQ